MDLYYLDYPVLAGAIFWAILFLCYNYEYGVFDRPETYKQNLGPALNFYKPSYIEIF